MCGATSMISRQLLCVTHNYQCKLKDGITILRCGIDLKCACGLCAPEGLGFCFEDRLNQSHVLYLCEPLVHHLCQLTLSHAKRDRWQKPGQFCITSDQNKGLGPVVQKLVNVNLGLKVNQVLCYSCVKAFPRLILSLRIRRVFLKLLIIKLFHRRFLINI